MSALARDAAAFKSSLKRQEFASWHSSPGKQSNASSPGPPPESAASSSSSSSKKKRPKQNIVYSQPADTGTGVDLNTQIVYAVDHLKKSGNPMRLQDLAIMTNTALETNPVLLERFRAHDRVVHDPNTDLYSYKHDFNARSKATLLTDIQRHNKKGGGIAVRTLRESWKDAPAAIEELEAEGEVLVTRTQKDQQMRMVFWNEIKPIEGTGGMPVEKEFKDLWHSLKVPVDADLLRALASEGLQAANAETTIPKAPLAKKKGKKTASRARQVRLTNVHLKNNLDLSRDYVPDSSK